MLSTKYRVRLTDICCRIISEDTVTIEERMWMNKLCEHNQQAKDLRRVFTYALIYWSGIKCLVLLQTFRLMKYGCERNT